MTTMCAAKLTDDDDYYLVDAYDEKNCFVDDDDGD